MGRISRDYLVKAHTGSSRINTCTHLGKTFDLAKFLCGGENVLFSLALEKPTFQIIALCFSLERFKRFLGVVEAHFSTEA